MAVTPDRLLINARPDLYSQLHSQKNLADYIDIDGLSIGSHTKVWWKCREDPTHFWLTTASERIRGRGCSMCSGRYIVHGVNDLSKLNPDLYNELHLQRNFNDKIDISSLSLFSNKKVWWKCTKVETHYWKSVVNSRSGKDKSGCAMCANKYIVPGINDFATKNPNLYSKLHFELNEENSINVFDISSTSNQKVWWKCEKDEKHIWKATVNSRSGKNASGCPICSNQLIILGVNDLSTTSPDLFKQLHPTRNAEYGINVSLLAPKSGQKVWWQCDKEENHYWKTDVASRVGGRGCPLCLNQIVVHGINDLSVTHPDLFNQLHPTRNAEYGIDITILAPRTGKKVWWQCTKDERHYWDSALASRSAFSLGCPLCSNQLVRNGINDLSVINPELFDQLHPVLNAEYGIDIMTLSPNTPKKVWWQCNKDERHYWKTAVSQRASGSKCPVCSNHLIINGINDLSVSYPVIFKDLHPILNAEHGIDITTLAPNTPKKVWWQCNKDERHYWEASINNRTAQNTNCAVCANQIVIYGINDLSVADPDLFNQLHPTLNFDYGIDITKLSPNTQKKVWWQCTKEEDHYWEASVYNRFGHRRSGCSICVNRTALHGINDLSVADPNLFSELHPVLNAEHGIDITRIPPNSGKKVWWQCNKDERHYWEAALYSRMGKEKVGCPMCSNMLIVHGINDLSVANPELFNQLHPVLNIEHGIDITRLARGTAKKVWWQCDKDERHHWKAALYSRLGKDKVGCPMCSNRLVIFGLNDLSVVNPNLFSELHSSLNIENGIETNRLAPNSGKKVWWQCTKEKDHVWKTSVDGRNGNKKLGCPQCSESGTSKIQQAFHQEIKKHIPDLECDVTIWKPFNAKKFMKVDIISNDMKVAIEYDGEYYHSGIRSKRGLSYHLKHDINKTKALLNAGYKVVRIRENILEHLEFEDKNFYQLSYKPGTDVSTTTDLIVKWFNSKKVSNDLH